MQTNLPTQGKIPTFRRSSGYYLLLIGLGLDVAILGPTLPALAGQTRVGLGEIGLLFLAGAIGSALGTAVNSRVFDRINGHRVLGFAQFCAAALIAFIPFIPWFWLLVFIVACKGLAQGFVNTGANTLLVWTHGAKSGPYMNALHFFFGLGAFLSPLLAAQLMDSAYGYRLVYWASAIFAGLAGIYMLTLSGGSQPVQGEIKPAGISKRGSTPWAFVLSAALFLFFYVGAEIAFSGWIYTYAFMLGMASKTGAAYLNSAFWLSFTIGRLISIPIAVRLKPQQVIPAALIGCLVFLGLMLFFPGSGAALWAATIGLGLCMAPIWPTGFTLASQSVNLSGRLSGLIILGDSFGGMLLPAALGRVIETAGPRSMVYLILASLFLNLLALVIMLKLRPKGKDKSACSTPQQ